MNPFSCPAAWGLTLLCCSCALVAPKPDPSRSFVLTPVGESATVECEPDRPLQIGLGPVRLPDYLDRPEMVMRHGANELRAVVLDLWASPLADQFRSTLQEDLARLLDRSEIAPYPWYPRRFDATVQVDVLRFDVDEPGTARLVARWQIGDGKGGDAVTAHESHLTAQAASDDEAAAVVALNQTLTAFSRELARAVVAVTVLDDTARADGSCPRPDHRSARR